MAMNLTKLTNAEYPLRDAREAIDGDNALNPSDPSAYYTAAGNPPGVWIGKGAELVGGKVGTTASSKTVRALINERRNPSNGQYLGDIKMSEGDNGEAPVAGFDLTTRQPKSISILWAFGDKETRDGIDECMRKATEMTIEYFENEYATTRAGQGGVASVSADGVAGFVFDHYDNRNGDPQPHKHIVISNRVRRSSDKMWTALDGRKIYAGMVEISEVHENLLQDLLTERFGWSWTLKQDNGTKAMVNEVDGVPQELINAFSSRDAEIDLLLEKKIKEYETSTGKQAGWRMKAELHKEAWLATRKAKPEIQPSLKAKRDHWYRKLGEVAPGIQLDQMFKDVNSRKTRLMHVDADCEDDIARLLLGQLADLTHLAGGGDEYLDRQARAVIRKTVNAHTVWKRTNVRAEAERLLREVRIDPTQRVIVANKIADKALSQCVKLTPDRYKLPPGALDDLSIATRQGQSVFEDADLDQYTTVDVLEAERYMISGLDKTTGVGYKPGEGNQWLDQWNERMSAQGGYPLAPDQQKAAAYALENPRLVSSIIGPAGTGKTTTMKAVAQAWQAKYGEGSVIGLATSARAVGELKDSIGCESMTIAMLLTLNNPERIKAEIQQEGRLQQQLRNASNPLERLFIRTRIATRHITDSSTIRPNQLIIVDEAGMTDTRLLQWITKLAEFHGAKVILTGDPKQLDSVSGAGGMLGYADRHGKCERLTSLWRFTGKAEKWADDPDGPASRRRWEGEADATLRLREGGDRLDESSVDECRRLIDEYMEHDRIHWGEDVDLEEEAYQMCIKWQALGKSTLLLAGTNAQVRDINQRFILERRAQGRSESDPAKLCRLRDGLDVGTGDQIVCRTNSRNVRDQIGRPIENGMTFKIISTGKAGARCVNLADGVECRIPNDWLKEACEAGYAATVHRSQGMTVDRCAAVFPSDENMACNLQYVAGSRGKEENHFLFGCKSEEDRHIDHMLTGAEEDPRKIAMSRMLDSLLTHTETMTATETMEQEYKDRYDLKRLLREHDYAAGLIAGPHLLAMLGKTHDARTVDKIKRSPSFEWLRGVWSRAYMTDPKRATAIIRQSLEKKPRRLTAEKAEHAAIHAARGMMPAAGTETGGTFTLDMDAPSDMIETVRHMMDETGIPYHEEPSLDPGRSRFSMDERYTPAVKAMLDAHIQARDDIDQSMFPEWEALRKTARGIINDDPDLKKKNRPVEPDWAATIAGRLNANLLDRVNGSVHDDWVGGILPPIRSRKHDAALDLVRQNERLIETRIDSLEQEARRTKQAWVGQVLAAAGDSDKRLLRDVVVYRAMWSVEDADNPLGERPPAESGRQEQHWANLNGRINHTSGVVKPPKPTREGTRIPVTAKTPIKEKAPIRKEPVVHVEGKLLDSGIPMDTKPTPDGDRLLGRCSRDIGFISRMSDIADEAALDFIHGRYDPDVTLGRIRDEVGGIAQACRETFGEDYSDHIDEAAQSALDALTDPINGRIARLADHGTGEAEIIDANRRDRMRRLEEYYMERAVMDADERSHDTYSLLPPTIRQSLDALTMTYGGTATDLMDAEPIQNKRTMQPMDHDMPTWDELRQCSTTIEEYYETHPSDRHEGRLPEDVEQSLLTLASMYGMGREADQKELETMRETLHRLPMDESHVEQTTENNNERTATWQESSRLS